MRLDLQGTSMEGPIPSSISLLTKLKELRITDLAGTSSSSFPNLQAMTQMTRLILRNCLLNGSIPEDIGEPSDLKLIDLSFNNLSGPIPKSFLTLRFNFLFLNNNSLSGEIPAWVFSSIQKMLVIPLNHYKFIIMLYVFSLCDSNVETYDSYHFFIL
ncbi:putative non-specific serine/threonine protein kinase [Helianthus annuus]|nr:putative non-specific serine/threonine protein kinase [Helianthus annuus]